MSADYLAVAVPAAHDAVVPIVHGASGGDSTLAAVGYAAVGLDLPCLLAELVSATVVTYRARTWRENAGSAT